MRGSPRPPVPGEWLVRRLVAGPLAENLLGDLAEEYADRVAAGESSFRVRRWYWAEVLALLRPSVIRGLRSDPPGPASQERKDLVTVLFQDIRFAWRAIVAHPGFAAMAITTIALGIGGTTTVFSAMDGFVLRPFPFPDQDRLVTVGSAHPKVGGELTYFEHLSPAEYLDIKTIRSVERVVAWDLGNRQVTVGETTENLFTGFWWGDAFGTIGLAPFLGRGFSPEEIDRGDRVAVVSHRVWQDRFGADSSLIGGKLLVNGEPYSVIGVMPVRALVYGTDLWIPFSAKPEVFPRDRRMLQILARLSPGASMASFGAELEGLARRTEAEYVAGMPEYLGWRLVPRTWADANVAQLKPAAIAMVGAIIFVMLLVCTNVATLLLGRAAARAREIALRAALGASRGRLLRQLLTESLLLSLLGAVGGVGLGWLGIAGVNRLLNSLPVSVFSELSLNGAVLFATGIVAVAAGLLFGTVPALQVLRSDLRGTLQAGSALGGTRPRLRLQRVLIGVEAALALTLLAGSGYLLRSLAAMRAVDPGFEPTRVLTMRLTLARERYKPEAVEPFFQVLRERVRAIPGVAAVASASQFPPNLFGRAEFLIEGVADEEGKTKPFAYTTIASPEYFETLMIPLKRGPVLALRVLTPDGTPVEQFRAACAESSYERFFSGEEIRSSMFRLNAAEPGRKYRVFINCEKAKAGGVFEVEAPADGKPIDVTLQPWATIRGRYVYDGGAPAPEVSNFTRFRLYPDQEPEGNEIFNLPYYGNFSGHRDPKSVTDADGNFELVGIIPGAFIYLSLNNEFAGGNRYHEIGILKAGETKDVGELVIHANR